MTRPERIQPYRGSYWAALYQAMLRTNGPVVELGAGVYSTPFLHIMCEAAQRPLATYENVQQFYDYASYYRTPLHRVELVTDWNALDLSAPCSVALVDCEPPPRLWALAKLSHAEYVVAHDSNARRHQYRRALRWYKYRRDFVAHRPHTLVLSNTHPLDGFRDT